MRRFFHPAAESPRQRAQGPPKIKLTADERKKIRDDVLREMLKDKFANPDSKGLDVDQIDSSALEAWINKQQAKKSKGKVQKFLAGDNNRVSKIIEMYNLYGSDGTALVK